MKIVYVLDRPELGGGVKVVLRHAALLQATHDVTVLGRGPAPTWYARRVPYINYERQAVDHLHADLVIATYWTTFEIARELSLSPNIHLCQGYEADYLHLKAQRYKIEEAYANHLLPTWVVSPHLGEFVARQYGRQWFYTPPTVEDYFHPPLWKRPPKPPFTILIHGIFEAEFKNVHTALHTVNSLRNKGIHCRTRRISVLPLSEQEEAILRPDEYFQHISPRRVARLTRTSDLCLFTSTAVEGFGMPLLEAMCSKVPVVSSDIPSVRYITQGELSLIPVGDAHACTAQASKLLTDPAAHKQAREHVYALSQRFSPKVVQKTLNQAVEWAYEHQ